MGDEEITALAEQFSQGRIVSTLEGATTYRLWLIQPWRI